MPVINTDKLLVRGRNRRAVREFSRRAQQILDINVTQPKFPLTMLSVAQRNQLRKIQERLNETLFATMANALEFDA